MATSRNKSRSTSKPESTKEVPPEEAPEVTSTPTPAEEEEKKEAPAQVVVGIPKLRRSSPNIPHAQVMDIDVFLNRQKVKPDHRAGFHVFAKQKKLPRLSLAQWRAEWDEYVKRPVK